MSPDPTELPSMPFDAFDVTVAWTVEPVPLGYRALFGAGKVALGTVSVAATLALLALAFSSSAGGGFQPVWLLGPDFKDVKGRGRLRGTGPAAWQGFTVDIWPEHASTTPGLRTVELPLRELTLTDAHYRGRSHLPRKRAHAPWELHLVGEGSDFTLRGAWLQLAHLGTLGGWPEPA